MKRIVLCTGLAFASSALQADRENLVPMLHAFARDFLEVDYMFWVDQEPYFEQDVLPCFDPGG